MTRENISVDTYEAARRRLTKLCDPDVAGRVETFADLFRQIKSAGDDLRTIAQIHGRYNDYEGAWALSGVVRNAWLQGRKIDTVTYHFFTNRAISDVGIKDGSGNSELARFHVPHRMAMYEPDYYLAHADNLPGFEAAKFPAVTKPPTPEGNPPEYFYPHREPDNQRVQQGFVAVMQDCLGVVLEGTRQNDRRISLHPGVVDSAQGVDLGDDFTLFRVPFDRRTPKLGQGLVVLGPYELK